MTLRLIHEEEGKSGMPLDLTVTNRCGSNIPLKRLGSVFSFERVRFWDGDTIRGGEGGGVRLTGKGG